MAPLAVGLNDNLGLISFRGHTGSSFSSTRAFIASQATEAWSPTATGSRLVFGTTKNGTTGVSTVMEITQDKKVKINGSELIVPDYVFEEDNQLMSLDELAVFIKQNKHLPGVSSAEEVKNGGLDIAGSQLSVLEKVEELTLYTLQQHEQLHGLKTENTLLKERNAALSKRLELLEQQQTDMKNVVTFLLKNQQAQTVLTGVVAN